MEKNRALVLFALWGAVSLALALTGDITKEPWGRVLSLPLGAFTLGPAFLLLLLPHALASDRRWVRAGATLLPVLSGTCIATETLHRATYADRVGAKLLSFDNGILLHLALLLFLVLALAVVLLRGDGIGWRWTLLGAVPFALLALFPLTEDLPFLLLGAFEAAAFLALTGFHRAPREWLRATSIGAAVFLVGLVAITAAHGSLMPFRLAIDEASFEALIVPLALVAAVAFLGTLVLTRRPVQGAAASP